MNARWIVALGVAASLLAGCGDPPSAKFVVNERTEKLYRPAHSAVEAELVRSFGDPNRLVAWRKLPIDFGEFEGVVVEPAQSMADGLRVQLTRKAPEVVPLPVDALIGAGFLWTSGASSDVSTVAIRGKDMPVDFQVERFDPKSSELHLRVFPGEVAGGLAAPKKGDKFAIVGPVLQHGRKLYMTHCVHCHGVSGDGKGPTAAYFDIKPRDYRLGVFKFTSTRNTDKARRDDLARTVLHGIPGTYMPSFLTFTDIELGTIVEYVRWLSMRGEFERKVDVEFDDFSSQAVAQRKKGGESQQQIDEGLAELVDKRLPKIASDTGEDLASAWLGAEQGESVVMPKQHRTADSAESRERGRKLFLSDVAKCSQCHGPVGHGDGPQTEDYQEIKGTTRKHDKPGLFDDWDNPIKPRDLTTGIYRGGRRPLDLYRRVYSGIKGTPMPPFGTALTDPQIWDLVNYVMSLPYKSGPESPQEPQQSKIASTGAPAELERIDVKKFWVLFFIFWPIVAIAVSVISPAERWWFPTDAQSPIGQQIDDLFYMILIIVAITFVGTQIALGYVLWRGARDTDSPGRALFTHGSHSLEVLWTIVPAGILLFIALYQLDVWAAYRVKENYPMESRLSPVAEVTARQFEWRIRYPALSRKFKSLGDVDNWLKHPEPGDLHAVNEMHVPTGRAVVIHLRSADVQHAFFVPDLRVKQDAVPGLVIPIIFEVLEPRLYEWVCAELCGWGHYKMKARVIAEPKEDYQAYLKKLEREQFDDGVAEKPAGAQAAAKPASNEFTPSKSSR